MKRNRISKNQAARAIARAVRNGWTRQIDVFRNATGQPWGVIVMLRKNRGPSWSQLFVNFIKHAKSQRWSARLRSQSDYRPKLTEGRSEFGYQLSRLT